MNILTTEGYKDIEDISIGDEVIGKNGINILENKRILDKQWFIEQGLESEWKWYLINGKYKFFHHQNIFVSKGDYNLCHTFELQIGWKIIDINGSEIEIQSIEETTEENIWWKLDISNDHSFISQDIQLHNASRYWVGGGSSANWSATGTTNWSGADGGANNATVPGATDDVIFNGNGANANTNSTISANITILSFTSTSGYTATITRNATLTVAGNFTLHKNTNWSGTSGLSISATSTITANGFSAGDTFWNSSLVFGTVAKTVTLVSSSNDIKITGAFTTSISTQTVNSTGVTLTLQGGLNTTAGNMAGTAKVVLAGGTWQGGTITNSIDLQGNVTITGTINYNTGTLKYVSGTLTVTGSTINTTAATTFDLNGTSLNNLSLNNGTSIQTITISSSFSLLGNLSTNCSTGTLNINGSTINVAGNFTMNSMTTGIVTGTSNITLNGTSPTISMTSVTSGGLRNNIEFAHSGTTTITGGSISGSNGGFRYFANAATNGTMKFTSGTISISDRLILVGAASNIVTLTCNTSGITLDYVVIRSTNTSANININGTNGLTFGTLDLQYTGSNNTTITLKFGNTYNISTLFKTDISGLAATNQTTEFLIVSDTPGSKVVLTLSATANQSLYHVDFTDINASNGQTIYTFDGLDNVLNLSNVSNIKKTPTGPITVVY